MDSVEAELRRARPSDATPADLHGSILQAVRRAAREAEPQSTSRVWRWVSAPAMAIVVAALVWVWWPQPTVERTPWTAAGTALERVHAMPQQASSVVLAPLSEELEFLDRDVRKAVDVLLASVP